MSDLKEGDEPFDEAWNSGEDTTGDPSQATLMADRADCDELDVPEEGLVGPAGCARASTSPDLQQMDSNGVQADKISPIGRKVPFTRPVPPLMPKSPDLGPSCGAQARTRRVAPSQDPEFGTGHPSLPARATSPPLTPLTGEIRSGSPWSDPPGTMDPILEDDERQGNFATRPFYMTEFMSSMLPVSSSASSRSQASRYSGTPQADHENGSLAADSQGASNTSGQSGGLASKVSMPRHVACIRKQILASRRLEELDLCTLSGSARRQRSGSARRSSTAD